MPKNRRNYGDSLEILYLNGYLTRNSAAQQLRKVQFHLLSVIFFAVEDVCSELVVCLQIASFFVSLFSGGVKRLAVRLALPDTND